MLAQTENVTLDGISEKKKSTGPIPLTNNCSSNSAIFASNLRQNGTESFEFSGITEI